MFPEKNLIMRTTKLFKDDFPRPSCFATERVEYSNKYILTGFRNKIWTIDNRQQEKATKVS